MDDVRLFGGGDCSQYDINKAKIMVTNIQYIVNITNVIIIMHHNYASLCIIIMYKYMYV